MFETMTPKRNLIHRGIALILIATLGIVLMNTCAKMSSDDHGPIELVFYRGIVALLLLTPYMLRTRSTKMFQTQRVGQHIYRALVGNLGIAFTFWAYALMPMADATALLYSAPLFVVLLSPLLLNETVGYYRWKAVIFGFLGIILIAQPSGAGVMNLSALVGVGAAICIALVDIALRDLGRTDAPLTTVFYFLLIGVLFSAPYTLLYGSFPQLQHIPWVFGIGIFAAIQQVAKTTAFQYAEASLLAPYTYSSIICATIAGWVFWRDIPTSSAIAGAILIIGSNLLTLRKEVPRSR